MKKNFLFLSLIVIFISPIASKAIVPGLAQTSSTPIINIYNNIPTRSSGSVSSVLKFLVIAAGFWEGSAWYFGFPEWGLFKKVFKPAFNWLKTQTRDQALRFADFLAARQDSVILGLFISNTVKSFINCFFDGKFPVAQERINVRNKEENSDQKSRLRADLKHNLDPLEKQAENDLNNTSNDFMPSHKINSGSSVLNRVAKMTNMFEPSVPHDTKPDVLQPAATVLELQQGVLADEFVKKKVEKNARLSEMIKEWKIINSANYSTEYLKNEECVKKFPKFCSLPFKIKRWFIEYFRETAQNFLLRDRIGSDVTKFNEHMLNCHFDFEKRPNYFLSMYRGYQISQLQYKPSILQMRAAL